MSATPRTRPVLAFALVLAVLASPSILVAGAVQLAVTLDGRDCPVPEPCFGGGR